jgi:hypothetical protein
MSKIYSPKITTDGLVMCLDASQNKSYPAADLPVKGGLILWLDAADDTTFSYSSGAVVSQWRDKSGLNNHVAQSTVANQPSRSSILNSRKIIVFDGSNDSLSTANSLDLSTTHTIFAIASQSVGSSDAGLVSINNTLNNGMTLHNASGYYAYFGNGGYYATSSITGSTSYIFTKIFKGSSSTTRQIYLNGTSATSSGTITSTDASGVIRLGQQTTYLNGTIAEVIIFNRELTATELKQVHTYLGQKWGISNTDRSIIDLAGNDDNGLFGNGTVANMPDYDFYNKGALTFNGTSDYVNLGNASSIRMGTSNFTISTWVKILTQTGTPTFKLIITSKNAAAAAAGYGFAWNNSVNKFLWSTANGSSSSEIFTTNTWSSLEGVWANIVMIRQNGATNNGHFYINGVYESLASAATVLNVDTATNMTIANTADLNSSYWFKGLYGPVYIYSRALSATEVLQNYEAQKSKFANTIVQNGLVLNLDAGNPYSYAGAGTTWYDVSGNTKDFIIDGSGIIYNSGGYFTLADGGITRSATITNSTTCTVVVWIRTTDTQALTFKGNNSGSFYLAAYYVGQGFYSDNCGSPTYWIDTVSVSNPNPTYLDGNWHMWEMKNVNFSSWTTYEFNRYGGFTFGNGAVGQIMIYDRNLSSTESLQIYNATKGRFGL